MPLQAELSERALHTGETEGQGVHQQHTYGLPTCSQQALLHGQKRARR